MNSGNKNDPISLTGDRRYFVAEEIDISYIELKERLTRLFQRQHQSFRAYLVQAEFEKENVIKTVLWIISKSFPDRQLDHQISSIFISIFGSRKRLHVILLLDNGESGWRHLCCPFFTSSHYRYPQPDFYIITKERYGPEVRRARYKSKRLLGSHPEGYLLCDIDPPFTNHPSGMKIDKIVVTSRQPGYSVFSPDKWPASVDVAILTKQETSHRFIIAENDLEPIGSVKIHEFYISHGAQ